MAASPRFPSTFTEPLKGEIPKRQKMTEMIELEDQEELIGNEQDIETTAYKEAFDHFDWNHSGRIPTSVKPKLSNFCFDMFLDTLKDFLGMPSLYF